MFPAMFSADVLSQILVTIPAMFPADNFSIIPTTILAMLLAVVYVSGYVLG